jgi:subtilase-type serine protease
MGRKQKVCAALICLGLLTGTTAVQAATADAFRTEEYNRMGSLEYIHAAEAYAKGYSGKGVILGIRDGIVRQANGNFTGKTFLTPYTYTDDYPWEKSPHGSHVAGTMAANKDDIGMHGVAYAADLMSLNSLTGDVTNFTFLMQYPQVKVVNNSIGIDYYLEYQDLSKYGDLAGLTTFYQKNKDNTLEAVSAADFADYRVFLNNLNTIVNNDKLFVFAASNEGHLSSSLYTAVGNFYNVVNKNNILSVEACSSYPDNFAVDGQAIPRSNGPVFFSNLAMFTEDISLVAPGFQIGSTTATTTDATKLTYFTGTSMATPHVTGALGLVQEAYPYLSAKQLGDVVLSTTSAMTVDTSKPFYTLLSSSNDIVSYGLNLLCYDNRTKPTTPEDWKALILEATGYTAEQYEALLKKCNLVDGNNNILYNNFYFYNNVPKSVAFGQGLLNADLATNGLGALNAKRLAAADVDNTYAAGNGGKQALYKVNTAGYNSVWSNAISETRVLMPGYGVNQDADLADRQSFYRQYAKEQQEHHSEPLMKNKEAEIERLYWQIQCGAGG